MTQPKHGEFDRRVPIANTYELLQRLRDKNVPAELIVYKGFGHASANPKNAWLRTCTTGSGSISMFGVKSWSYRWGTRKIELPKVLTDS